LQLIIAKAKKEHIGHIKNIARTCWQQICPEVLHENSINSYIDKQYTSEELAKLLSDSSTWFYVMSDGDEVIGLCQLTRKDNDPAIGIFEKIFVLPDYQDHKIVYRLFQTALKAAVGDGVTEVEVNIPECSQKWRSIFIDIGVEFEPWRKFEQDIGGQNLAMWPGVLVIIPGC